MGYQDPGAAFRHGICVFAHRGKVVAAPGNISGRLGGLGIAREELHEFFRRMIDHHLAQGDSYTDRRGFYLYYSKSLNFGVVVDYEEDPVGGYQGLNFSVDAVLPKGERGAAVAREYRVLPFADLIDDVDDFCEYAGWLLQKYDGEKIIESERIYGYNTKSVIVNGYEIRLILCENRFWDIFELELVVIV